MKTGVQEIVERLAQNSMDSTSLVSRRNDPAHAHPSVASILCQIQAGMLYDFLILISEPDNIGPKVSVEGKEIPTAEVILDHVINTICRPIWKRRGGDEFLLESKRRALEMLKERANGEAKRLG